VVFPVVGEQTLRDLVREWKATGPTYRTTLRTVIRNSYSGHYRQVVPKLVETLTFRSNNEVHQPVISALELVKRYADTRLRFFPVRLGTAETEAILRRFTRSNVQHPTYKALAELGKAIKTLFFCRYLHEETLRREIHEGLNVIKHWNGANDFVFFARRGELAGNRTEDHELSMLSLHFLQNCMVYINTLMMQQVLSRPRWAERFTTTDLRALTPLIWEHVNPYGRFELNMETRLDLSPNGP
jgi:Tn3 transposase DDE domain